MDPLQLFFEISGLILTLIIAVAGIKYIWDGIRKYQLRKLLKDPKKNREKIKEIVSKEHYKRVAKGMLEGKTYSNIIKMLDEINTTLDLKLYDIL